VFGVPFLLPDYGKFAFNEYGDFVGGVVASIWSLAGLMFIYVAFLGQKLQLLLQQLELRYTHVTASNTNPVHSVINDSSVNHFLERNVCIGQI
jgi:hypothetical protein